MVEGIYRAAAAGVLAIHLMWIAWVIVGARFTRNRPGLKWFHIGSLLYGIAVETIRFPCPLTTAERWLMVRGGIEPYDEPFLVHYLRMLVYPTISPLILIWGGVAVCVFNLAIYANRLRFEAQS
ncbi:MAG TPA: DUF2784 domain-containing protein [Candidatus Binataceae bacterium]|jgi:hypothetical protein